MVSLLRGMGEMRVFEVSAHHDFSDHPASYYMFYVFILQCCSGLPFADKYHAENIANFSLAVVECVKHVLSPVDGKPISLRIGIHTGSCTSGVVGTLTPHYCVRTACYYHC